jgi:ankyrin repeat protein
MDALYELIQMDAKVLDRMDDISFVETPLHIAASAGHTLFAREIMRLKPSFVRKLDQNGFTPMHLALQSNQTEMVLQLLDADKDLVRVKGKEGVTPLHYVAQIGNLDLLAKFLEVCPESIGDVTIRKETVLHIALKYNMYEAFQFLLRWLRDNWFAIASVYQKKLLGWQDDEGNTVLHMAVSKNQTEASSCFLLKENKLGSQWRSISCCTCIEVTIRIDHYIYNKLNNLFT